MSFSSHEGFAMTLVEADSVVIVRGHAWYDWDEVRSKAQVIVDTRNALRGRNGSCRVVRL